MCDHNIGLWSNHVLYSSDVFNVHISMLATAITVHGYNAEDLLIGTIVSLLMHLFEGVSW